MRHLVLLAALASLTRCSLLTYAPQVKIQVSLTGQESSARGRSPSLSTMKCYGLFVEGEAGAVTEGQIDGRSPSCLALTGAFHGPFTRDELAAGVSLSLAQATYRFSVVGFHDIASCGATIGSYYPSSTPASTYSIAQSAAVNLATTTSISLDASTYQNNAPNRTPSCPPSFTGCSSETFMLCDTFTDPDGTVLSTHVAERGGPWTLGTLFTEQLYGGKVRIDAQAGGVYSYAYQTGAFDGIATADFSLGEGPGDHQVMLYGRYTSATGFIMAVLRRNKPEGDCILQLVERDAGGPIVRASTPLDLATDCPDTFAGPLTLELIGADARATYRGHEVNYGAVNPGYSIPRWGFGAEDDSGDFGNARVDNFRFVKYARRPGD